jgi:glycosyltransferase involved in cell wall biosynthesis
MKKYLLIGDGESPHILKWARELDKHFELYLVSSRGVSPEIRGFMPEERIHAFRMNIAESGGNLKFYRMILPLKRIIRQIKPDYVNAHYITSHGLVAALARKFTSHKFSLILSAWGTDILVTPSRNNFYRKITRFALSQACLVTTDSLSVAEVVHSLSSTPTMTFPFGLEELPDVRPEEKEMNLFFSNRTLNANSNIDRIIHFFDRILEKDPSSKLIIGNDGPLKDELKFLCAELGISDNVEFVGFISSDEQNGYYRRAGFFFSVLTSDALSVSLLEAMAFGCIPIISELPDNTDWVKDNENGLLLRDTSEPGDLIKLKNEQGRIFRTNRDLIAKRAIFPEAVEQFVQSLINIR